MILIRIRKTYAAYPSKTHNSFFHKETKNSLYLLSRAKNAFLFLLKPTLATVFKIDLKYNEKLLYTQAEMINQPYLRVRTAAEL